MYVCMYECMYVCMYACAMSVSNYEYRYMVIVYVFSNILLLVCVCMYVYMYVCRYVCMYMYVYVCMYVFSRFSHLTPPAMAPTKIIKAPSPTSPHTSSHPFTGPKDQFTGVADMYVCMYVCAYIYSYAYMHPSTYVFSSVSIRGICVCWYNISQSYVRTYLCMYCMYEWALCIHSR